MIKGIKTYFRNPEELWKNYKFAEYLEMDEYKKIYNYGKSFEPQKDISYEWIYNHSMKQYGEVVDTLKDMDKKADSMIKYLAPSSGLLSIVLGLISLNMNSVWLLISITTGVALLIGAMVFSLMAVKPMQQCILPTTTNALEIQEYFKDDNFAKGDFAICIEGAVQILSYVNHIKARRIDFSYRLFMGAVTWLLVTMIIFLFISL